MTGAADDEEDGDTSAAMAAAEEEGEDEAAERERREDEDQEDTIVAARPALIFCRVVDALQAALKPGGEERGTAAGTGTGRGGHGALEAFLSGGDDFLLAASSAAHEAYERAIKPLSKGGGVVANLEAMGLRDAFAEDAGGGGGSARGERESRGERERAAACRERVMNLLCEGELFALAGSRS